MVPTDLQERYTEFSADLALEAALTGESLSEAFLRRYADIAAENGDCPDLQLSAIRSQGGAAYQVDGYAWEAERGTLYLAIGDYREGTVLESLNSAQLERLTGRVRRYVELLLTTSFQESFAKNSAEFECGSTIAAQPALLKRIQILLFSGARLATRKPPELAGEIAGRPVVSNILDFDRFVTIEESRGAPEPLTIDLTALAGTPLPCLPASQDAGQHESFLAAMPATLLASIYGLYGPRLLEQNVRTFLQARTKVNRGIITTIRETPGMFFAYNNGITATASGVRTVRLPDGGLAIESIHDLQIVNGGQTTASILYARDNARASLDEVYVQMKLTVVRPEVVSDVVPRISRFANTQNRISEADFFSSHPFHLAMEQLSRRLSAPPRAGAATGSRWFYERARGQYRDARGRGTAAERRRFEIEFPKTQLIEKTDLAKYELTFGAKPHTVCLGAQKCFLVFAERISRQWESSPLEFNETWFKAAVARTLVFRWTDQMIGASDWYREDRGYKAQTVAYAISWLMHDLRRKGRAGLDLELIWRLQGVPEELRAALTTIAPQIAPLLRAAPESMRNVSEFCKLQACWSAVSRAELSYPELPESLVLDVEAAREVSRDAVTLQKLDLDIELDRLLLAMIPRIPDLQAFARSKGLLSPKSDEIVRKVATGQLPSRPSDRSATRQLLQRAVAEGYVLPDHDADEGTAPGDPRRITLSGRTIRQVRT